MFGFDVILAYIRKQIGLRTDAADPAGSLHAKVKNIADNQIGDSSDVRSDNTVMGWLASPIKSIQRGVTSVVGTQTSAITAVNTAKSMVNYTGRICTIGEYTGDQGAYIRLTSSTELTATGLGGGTHTIAWEVIEFY